MTLPWISADGTRRLYEEGELIEERWMTMRQRDDLKPCPFCGTAAIEQRDSRFMLYRINCGNPFCICRCTSGHMKDLKDAEAAWQQRWTNVEIDEDATQRRLCVLETESEARHEAAELIYDKVLVLDKRSDLASLVLSNASLYLIMGDLYPGPYTRSPLEEFFAS